MTPAISACSAKDAHLASLWGGEERDFVVDKLWKVSAERHSVSECLCQPSRKQLSRVQHEAGDVKLKYWIL